VPAEAIIDDRRVDLDFLRRFGWVIESDGISPPLDQPEPDID
jgi:hypothetical protein